MSIQIESYSEKHEISEKLHDWNDLNKITYKKMTAYMSIDF